MIEGEKTADIRIMCFEERKVRRVSLIVEGWSEDPDMVVLKIEDRNLVTDNVEFAKVDVPFRALRSALKAMETLFDAERS